MKYRKKPVIIEAVQWTGKNVSEIDEFTGYKSLWADNLVKYYPPSEQYKSTILEIQNSKENTRVDIGDFVIKDENGDFYPCKPNVFEKTYEAVTD